MIMGRKENDKSNEEFKKKDKDIYRLQNHNQTLLNRKKKI
jgi:hypothetical protein